MFELDAYDCPACGTGIAGRLSDGQEIACKACSRRFCVLLDPQTRSVGMVPLDKPTLVEPLNLPQGSIRALSTFLVAGAAWLLMLTDRPVPAYVFSLLLTVIAYYFGFRKKTGLAQSRIYDAGARKNPPLFLPPGFIRFILIAGFAACGAVLYLRGRFREIQYVEFYVLLAGLVLGYIFGRAVRPIRDDIENWINHAKGAAVLLASAGLFILLLSPPAPNTIYFGLTLACIITFYFGSRS